MLTRRRCCAGAGLAVVALRSGVAVAADATRPAEAAIRSGGVVVAMRHALAPGTFDPPGFRLGDCTTQRNLSDDGRAQARRIGTWFTARGLRPTRVRSSPWCRCVDTADLAFAAAEVWLALGSPYGAADSDNAARRRERRAALIAASAQAGRFEVWVTHDFVLSDLASAGAGSGEALVLRADAAGSVRLLARLPAP